MRLCIWGVPVTSPHPTPLAGEGSSGWYLLEQLPWNWQDPSTASQLVTATSEATVGFFLKRLSAVGSPEGDCGQLCVVWVYSQKKPERLHLVKIRNWRSWVVWPESREKEIKPVVASMKVKAGGNLLILWEFLTDIYKSGFSLGVEALKAGCW